MAANRTWNDDQIPDQTGRTVVITGANSGLGLCSARALARHGAEVILACRSPERGKTALTDAASVASGADPRLLELDLADLGSIAQAADELRSSTRRIDVLMNNAGVMALPLRRTADDFEAQFGTNHLGHFALTAQLFPLLLAADAPRVVTTSSIMHRVGRMRWDDLNWQRGYRKWLAYGQSKLANLLFAFELDRQAKERALALSSMAAHPGYASTHLQAAGSEITGNKAMLWATNLGNRIFAQSDQMGALPQLYAATAADVEGGQFYGPSQLFESRGSPKVVRAMPAAYNRESARRLWDRSEELTGVEFAWPATTRTSAS
jgi:NAD(P)-dependent dehydrogenase (short-subunit alcohol dehydrogenase family)